MKVCPASDQSLLVYLGEEIGLENHQRTCKLMRLLQKDPPDWLRNLQPAYTSLMVTFDACLVDHAQVESVLRTYAERAEALPSPNPRTVEIPVCYGGEYGPDLVVLAKGHGLNPSEVIKIHTAKTYHAYFLGFAPGFAYLGEVAEEIATPRLASPRKKVSPGSVGIAGRQTAVYPFATPGGWNLIGRTPLALFQSDRKTMSLIAMGDLVRFRSISETEFSEWAPA